MNITNQTEIEEQFFELICYMIVSARNLIQETKLYGPLRLVEAAGRLLSLLERHGFHIPAATVLQKQIETAKASVGEDKVSFTIALEDLVSTLLPFLLRSGKLKDTGKAANAMLPKEL